MLVERLKRGLDEELPRIVKVFLPSMILAGMGIVDDFLGCLRFLSLFW